jgi:hypothetical protein
MLAMVVNDNAGCLTPCGDLRSIASVLAPTGTAVGCAQLRNAAPGILVMRTMRAP